MSPYDARTEELLDVLRRYRGKRLFVAVLGSPDPDGLASAWALKLLAREAGATMDILTFEVVSRPDNVAFVQQLAIPFRQVTQQLPRMGYEAYAVVDRQNARLPVPVRRTLPMIIHIDHHVPVPTGAIFSQQEPAFGSTCSVMAFHFAHLVRTARLDPNEACRVATALMHGIRTDTGDFVTCGTVDFQAASLLAPLVSSELSRTIVNMPLGRAFLDTLTTALPTVTQRDGFLIAFAGKVGRRARDTIGQTADFLSRTEGTRTVVVFGLVNGSYVGSLRSSSPTFDPYDFLDEALSDRLGFPVDCGGRAFAGGFQVPLSAMPGPDEESSRRILIDAILDTWSRRETTLRRRLRHASRAPAKDSPR